ncbi:hypothetical protein KP509_05G069800 [Ceratopteris richardii]|uniref:Uncharacterized protein n=1 Tax=Ceratopteris richardii TaxID=49495 RepID=A0A8T2UMN8_CERRI|nr:hypothetical protein KP509_05G069800 [Ceratopteris richardii]
MESLRKMNSDDGNGFVKDDFYESIEAPMWIDFDSPEEPVDDEEWFCRRSGCMHEETSSEDDLPKLGVEKVVLHSQSPMSISSPQIDSSTLKTVPEKMVMQQKTMNSADSADRNSSLVSQAIMHKLKIGCDSCTRHPIFATLLCCFP